MKTGTKSWLKKIGLICLIPIILVLFAVVLIYIPTVQNFVVKKITRYASESLDMQINVGYIRLSFPLNLNVKDISVIDNQNDTLLYSNKLDISIHPFPLLHKNISVRTLKLSDALFNSKALIDGVSVAGQVGILEVKAGNIFIAQEDVSLEHVRLSDSSISLRIDTISTSDTTKTQVKWKIASDEIRLKNIAFDLEMPVDSIRSDSFFDEVLLTEGKVDLSSETYSASLFKVSNSAINYDLKGDTEEPGLDPSHLKLTEIQIELAALFYQEKNINAQIQHFSLKEHSGLYIMSLDGTVVGDEEILSVPALTLETPYSKIEVQATVPWNTLNKNPQGNLSTQLIASIDRRDVVTIIGELPEAVKRFYPDTTFRLSGLVEGNLNKIHLRRLESELPGIFRIDAQGFVEKAADDIARSGEFYLKAQTDNDSYLRGILLEESNGRYTIPGDLSLELNASLAKGEYHASALLSEPSGNIELTGRYHPVNKEYGIDLKVDSLGLISFLPKDSIFRITASAKAQGKGSDLFANTTWTTFDISLADLLYKNYAISGISLTGSLEEHQLKATMNSNYPYTLANMSIDGNITKEKINGMLILNVDSLDLYGLQLTDRPFSNSFQVFSEVETDLKKNHLIDITLGNWEMAFGKQRVKPKTLTLHAIGTEDTTHVSFHAGDLGIYLTGNEELDSLIKKLSIVSTDAMRQLQEDSTVNLQQLRPLLPEIDLQITAKRDNPVYNYLQINNIFFDHFALNASTSPHNGINAKGLLYAFIKDTLKIDSVQLNVLQDSNKLNYTVDVVKNKFRQQQPFKAGVKGGLQYGKGDIEAYYLDGQGKTGLHIGASLEKQTGGWSMQLFPENPVIAYLPFKLNPDNYILFQNKDNIAANLRLDGDEYASIWVHSTEENGRMQELLAELSQINLDKLSAGFSTLPPLGGNANISLRYAPIQNTFMLVADANIDDLYYQKGRIGELLMSGVYLPLDKSRHQIDMHIFHDQHEISTLSTLFQSTKGEKGNINGHLDLDKMPLVMLNPFLMGTAHLNGTLSGSMSMQGTAQTPILNGYLQADTASVYVAMAGSQFRLDDKKINVTDSKITFDKYSIYSAGNNPFVINGNVNILNASKGIADLTLTAKNMQLLNAEKDAESLVYGKLFVDLNSTLKGPLNGLTMRGNLHLLGGTNMSYILRESPLTVQDRMNGLVTFTYFQDTIPRRNRIGNFRTGVRRETASLNRGVDMLMTIGIDPAVKFKVDLDEEASNRIELQGGGDLSFQYTTQGDMVLNGRYTLSDGLIKYNMPVISNKTLKIQEGSYVEWNGSPTDPYLNMKATERVRASVNQSGESARSVNFDAGVEIKQRLEDLSLQFTLDAVDDMTIQNQLAAMGPEEESKRAVAMLLTGVYIGDDQGDMKFDMGSALNSFLESEINNLTGDLLQGVDFSFGMESYDATGGQRTDYSFRFSKRFYNDRFNVIVGGIVSTGDVANQNDNFINDASIEYRLDRGGNRYAKLFYNRQYESLLEGEIARFGGGFIFRRKMRRLYELFGLKSKKTEIKDVTEENKK